MASLKNAFDTCCINDRYSKQFKTVEEPNKKYELKKKVELNSCSFDSRNRTNCQFTLDCESGPKNNQVNKPCPAESTQEILSCSSDNRSRSCPVVLCNYEQHAQENYDIFKRNFPDPASEIIPDYRGEYRVCAEYKNLNDIKNKGKDNLKNEITNFEYKDYYLNPGKPNGVEFLKKIDIDSDLRFKHKLKNVATLCPEKKYQFPECEKTDRLPNPAGSQGIYLSCSTDKTVCTPKLQSNPSCQNYKYYKFNDNTQKYRTKCKQKIQVVSKDISKKFELDPSMNDQIQFNYKNDNKTCFKRPIKKADPMSLLKQPILFQESSDMIDDHKLETGPERTEHYIENIWYNVTRRKHI